MIYCRIVYGGKDEGGEIEDPHGSCTMIEIEAIRDF